MDFYPWVVVAHVFFVIIAFGAHGASAYAMFQAKGETDRARLAAVLDLSGNSLGLAAVALILAVVLGILAAIMGNHFSRFWPWAAIGVVVVVYGVMTPLGANPMSNVRAALGLPSRLDRKGEPPRPPASDAELRAAQAKLRPGLLATIGVVAIAILVWLMELKPF
jgi:ABC-type amino acid transport system permease subunit